MHRIWPFLTTSLVFLSLSACVGFTEIQHSISNFNQAAHAAVSAEGAYLDAAQIVDCEDQYYSSALSYAQGESDNFDLTGYCKPRTITPEEMATRHALMNAIALYADKMQALASDKDDKQLDGNSKALAQNLNGLASSGGVKLQDPDLVQVVMTAFNTISKMVLDQVKYKDLRSAAKSMQQPIADVVKALNNENFGLGKAMVASLGKIEIVLRNAVAQQPPGPTRRASSADIFFYFVQARTILMSADPLTKHSLASPQDAAAAAANPKHLDGAKPVTDALNALVNANSAIANTGPGGINAAAKDLYQRATAAKDLYSSISNAK